MVQWFPLISSHGLVLFYLMRFNESTMKEAAACLELTERRVAAIISDLVDAKYLQIQREGRRNRYSINTQATFRHPTMSHLQLCEFTRLLIPETEPEPFKELAVKEGGDDPISGRRAARRRAI